MSTETILHISITVVSLLVGAGAWVYAIIQKSAALRAQEKLHQRIAQLENELTALMDGSFGMGVQLEDITRDLKGAIDRQQQSEQRDLGDLPYNEAIRQVASGAGTEQLIKSCGLSKSEAELVLLLHKASPPVISPESANEAREITQSETEVTETFGDSPQSPHGHPYSEARLHEIKSAPLN